MIKYLITIILISNSIFSLEAMIKTSKGDMTIILFYSESPKAVANFVNLANRGFYKGNDFHRIVPNLMIQTGDPTGTGRGNPGYKFEDEFNPNLKHDAVGVVSMVNLGPNTNGSQFFFTLEKIDWFDGKHTIFGKIIKGIEILKSLQKGDKIIDINIIGTIPDQIKSQQSFIDDCNRALDKNFPKLKSAQKL